jgi:uncharacterized NAD(P)/FAD-binding protein YdhS
VHPRLSERVKARLNEAIPVAREHLREYPACQALFKRLGVDGVAQLARTSYHPASRQQQRKYCRRDSHAVTEVDGSRVVVCRSFARLSAQQAAGILIHEALHNAGQTEYPAFPNAPDALEITEMVMEDCRFF